jgi:hypothetical protein
MKVKEILSEDEVSENMALKFNAETADFFLTQPSTTFASGIQ